MDLSPDLHADLEAIGSVLAAAVGPLVGKVEQARGIAVTLENELAEARHHLAAVLPLVGTTWAQDTAAVEAAAAFLNPED